MLLGQNVPNAWGGASALIWDMVFATEGGDVKADTSTRLLEDGDDRRLVSLCFAWAHFSTAPTQNEGSAAIIVLICIVTDRIAQDTHIADQYIQY